MDPASVIRAAPRTIELGGDPAAVCELDEELVALTGKAPPAAVATFEGDGVAVAPVAAAPAVGEDEIGPVYRARGGELAVPTGRVLVRFDAEEDPADHADVLAGAGFEIEKVVPYAPQAAWVRPREGGTAAALNGLEGLRSVPGVEHVEPQVLSRAARRSPEE